MRRTRIIKQFLKKSHFLLSFLMFVLIYNIRFNNYSETEIKLLDYTNDEIPMTAYDFDSTKKILFFTSFYEWKNFTFGLGNLPFVENRCPVTNCFLTDNKTLLGPRSLNQFDALIFHPRDMEPEKNGYFQIPNQKKRLAHQRYVMFMVESSTHDHLEYHKFPHFFNWTMTFRRDSDFYRPYGWIAPLSWHWHYPPAKPIDWKKYSKDTAYNRDRIIIPEKKYKSAAWLVSNCATESDREDYVNEMQNHFPVHIYGRCGNYACPDFDIGPTYDMKSKCFDFISKNYMFYLSFENSMCLDYVTEKFFKALNFGILPIVLGGANYSEIAPPKSYINVEDFTNPSQLSEYLQYLVKNHTAYEDYFQWKKYFKVHATKSDQNRAMCQLCEALNEDISQTKMYPRMEKWWKKGSKCKKQGSFPWSNLDKITTLSPEPVKNFLFGFVKKFRKNS